MPAHYIDAEKVCLVETYFATRSFNSARNELRHRFPNASTPCNSTILRLIRKFLSVGSVKDLQRKRRPTALSDEKMTEIQGDVLENPRISSRRLAQLVKVSHTTAYKAVRHELKLFPYKTTMVHQLLPADHEARLHFCEWLTEVLHHDDEFLDRCFFSDEAWFHLSGYVNTQNCRFWSGDNPHLIHESPLHAQKLGVWAAMSGQRIFVLFFDTTVNSQVYCGFVDQFVETLTEDEVFRLWFQQDNATAHTSKLSMNHLTAYFGERVISKGLWPPRSPDLSPPDFFLWGFLKDRVFQDNPQTLDQLRQRIVETVASIPATMLKSVTHSLASRMEMCISMQGKHFQHL
jgi:hypothetical protein